MNNELKEGQRKTVEYVYTRRECEECGEPATHRITFLLLNARSNPASSGYRGDNISWCSDAEKYACDEHRRSTMNDEPEGMTWGSDFYMVKDDGTLSNSAHMMYHWKKDKETLAHPQTEVGELYKCPSYVEGGKVINCNCGKCF